MDKRVPAILTISIIVIIITALSGCIGNSGNTRIVYTVQPTTTPAPVSVTPAPTPIPPATMATSDGVTTIKGMKDQTVMGITFTQGVYIAQWSSQDQDFSAYLSDTIGNSISTLSKGGQASGRKLLVVDGYSVVPGNAILTVSSNSSWTVTISRPKPSSATSLPLTIRGDGSSGMITDPFNAGGGNLKISYTISGKSWDDGVVKIYDISTGQSFYTRPIAAGDAVGQSNAEVPSAGVYIAQVTMPQGASYAEITLSQ